MRSVKHPFPAGKLPVRGRFRATCLVLGSAAVSNVRRMHRYLEEKTGTAGRRKQENREQNRHQEGLEALFSSFARSLRMVLTASVLPSGLNYRWYSASCCSGVIISSFTPCAFLRLGTASWSSSSRKGLRPPWTNGQRTGESPGTGRRLITHPLWGKGA